MAEEFELPDFLKDCDVDTIHERMLSELPTDIDKMQGGFPWDFTRPTALIASELLEMYVPLILQLMFPQWSTGKYLELLGNVVQIKRREATYATVDIVVTGTVGTYLPAGTAFSTSETDAEGVITFISDNGYSIGEGGTVTVHAIAEVAGKSGNVPEKTVILMQDVVDGVTQVENPEKASGGTDSEDDDTLRERILAGYQTNDESYVGNDADYKRWAESVQGMGTAIVVSEWNGPESVKIICTDANGEAASQDILDAIYDYIMSPNSRLDRLAPPNTILTVSAPESIEITYSLNVKLDTGYDLEKVKEAITASLENYYKTVPEEGALRYTRVGALISATNGVDDYDGLLINGKAENVLVSAEQFPVTKSIIIGYMAKAVDE